MYSPIAYVQILSAKRTFFYVWCMFLKLMDWAQMARRSIDLLTLLFTNDTLTLTYHLCYTDWWLFWLSLTTVTHISRGMTKCEKKTKHQQHKEARKQKFHWGTNVTEGPLRPLMMGPKSSKCKRTPPWLSCHSRALNCPVMILAHRRSGGPPCQDYEMPLLALGPVSVQCFTYIFFCDKSSWLGTSTPVSLQAYIYFFNQDLWHFSSRWTIMCFYCTFPYRYISEFDIKMKEKVEVGNDAM